MKFVNWPAKSGEEEDAQVIVGILGEDPFLGPRGLQHGSVTGEVDDGARLRGSIGG